MRGPRAAPLLRGWGCTRSQRGSSIRSARAWACYLCHNCSRKGFLTKAGAERPSLCHPFEMLDWEHVPELADLHRVGQSREQAERDLRAAVAVARAAGHSWELIGEALGVTRQSAWERFRSVDD
jgi:hypothetical protein